MEAGQRHLKKRVINLQTHRRLIGSHSLGSPRPHRQSCICAEKSDGGV